MKYDFETLVNRSSFGSTKWNIMHTQNPDLPEDIVPLSVADMELKNAPEIIEGLKAFLDERILGYTTPSEEYFEAVCSWMDRRHGWKVDPASIVCSPGVVPALYMLVSALCEKDDGVIVLSPVYGPFFGATRDNGRVLKSCPLICENDNYSIDYELLEKTAAESDSKLLIFCNPHNPVGRVWTPEELRRVGEICRRHNVKIISDEIHSDIIMPGYKHTPFPMAVDFGDDIIVCTAPSKTFNLAAMQTSNIILPNKEDREKFESIKRLYCVESGNALGFEACRLAYTEGEAWMEEMLSLVWDNYQFVVSFLKERLPMLTVSPLQGTYLAWMNCKKLSEDKDELKKIIYDKAMFYAVDGLSFGDVGSDYMRVNLACPKHVIVSAFERLEKAVNNR